MMKCREVAEIASDYLDHELGAWPNIQMRLHLLACRHCRAYVANLRFTIATLQGRTPDGQLSEHWLREVDRRVHTALAQRQNHP